ncbi:interactor of constitutive active ROPs 1 [Oryza sativa Japonica Group]|nr:interactor of constitutive active ROPs 1 [Oryza sativa Japonica Group]
MVACLQKKPAGGGAAVSRVAELEAKLGKAEGQLAEMREQLAAAEKARKDARAALVESKKRFSAAKKRVATAGAASSSAAAEQTPPQAVSDEKCGVISPAGDVPEAAEPGDAQGEETKEMADDDEVNSVTAAIVGDLEGNKGGQEVEQLRTKLMEKDMEVYELKAKLIAMDAEADDLRASLATKGMEIDELRAKLTSKDADIAAVEADNAELMKMAEEASHAVKETATKARDTEHALRESAAREAARVAERLRASERAREALEAELQRGRAQSEQWRKAAEEAAAVLAAVEHGAGAPAADVEWRRHSSGAAAGERVAKDTDEHHVSGGKRNSGGAMRMLSELWKKKAQK